MPLPHYIAFHLAFLACLASFMLGLGHNEMFLPIVTMVGAGVSLWVTDFKRIFKIGPVLSNTLVLIIVAIAIIYLCSNPVTELAVGIARALVFVQVVVFFRDKDVETRWNILLISFLQALVATVFQQDFVFAILMIVYVFAGLLTIVMMHIEQDRNFYQKNMFVRSLFRIRKSEFTLRQDFWRMTKIVAATLLTGPLSLVLKYDEKKETETEDPENIVSHWENKSVSEFHPTPAFAVTENVQWPYCDEKAFFSFSTARVSGLLGIGKELYIRLFWGTMASLFFGLFVFFLVPRFNEIDIMNITFSTEQGWQSEPIRSRHSVGFTDEIRLGSLGIVSQNTEKVFDVSFFDAKTHHLYTPIEFKPVYFRGVVLNDYSKGRWSGATQNQKTYEYQNSRRVVLTTEGYPYGERQNSYRVIDEDLIIPGTIVDVNETDHLAYMSDLDLVSMQFRYKHSRRNAILFTIWPFFVTHDQSRKLIRYQDRTEFRSSGGDYGRSSEMMLLTTAFQQGDQMKLTPCQEPFHIGRMLDFNQVEMPSIARLAKQWDSELLEHQPEADTIIRAQNLEMRLSTDPRFYYVLGGVTRNHHIDPLEDFVRDNPRGHCEYFAGALAMMLRSIGIPARLVLGYKTELLNPNQEGRYSVLENDAHSWVEVFVPADKIPENLKTGDYGAWWEFGGWLRLDPEPASAGEAQFHFSWNEWKQWLSQLWQKNFLNMDPANQSRSIYGPLLAFFKDFRSKFLDKAYWQEIAKSVVNRYKEIYLNFRQGRWQANDFIILALPLFILLLILYLVFRILIPSFMKQLRKWSLERSKRLELSPIMFYRRFEHLLTVIGLIRQPAETQREYAHRSAEFLLKQWTAAPQAESSSAIMPEITQEQLTRIPIRIAEAYYQVRYGKHQLPLETEHHLNESLGTLETIASLCKKRNFMKKG